uniref:Uncharacterized protein n=1 Tax=Glossina austeni TaxID=7395 RepID=A0A1A9V4U4_GLOAU
MFSNYVSMMDHQDLHHFHILWLDSLAIGFFLINTRRATEARAKPIPIFKATEKPLWKNQTSSSSSSSWLSALSLSLLLPFDAILEVSAVIFSSTFSSSSSSSSSSSFWDCRAAFFSSKHLQLLRKVHRHVRHHAPHHVRHHHEFHQKQQHDRHDRHVLVDVPLPNHQNN